MRVRSIITYLLVALIVVILGALSGWYFFIRTQTKATQQADAARGFTSGASSPSEAAPSRSGTASGVTTFNDGSRNNPGLFARVFNALFARTGSSASQPPASNSFGAIGTSGQFGAPSADTRSAAPAVQLPPLLWHAHAAPVAGVAFMQNGRVRFVERSSGNVMEADPMSGVITRLSGTLMPKIYEAAFSRDRILERSIENSGLISTFSGILATSTSISATSSLKSLSGVQLAPDIVRIAASPVSDSIVYLARDDRGIALWRAKADGSQQKRLFSSALPNWRLYYLPGATQKADKIILVQSASDGLSGYAYEVQNGTLEPITHAPGLTLLPRASGGFLSGQSSSGNLAFFLTRSQNDAPIRLSIKTVADKCAWAPSGTLAYCAVPQNAPTGDFLNNWYRGIVHTSDAIWRVGVSSSTAELVYSPENTIDVKDPVIDTTGTHIAFINAIDDTLWILRLER